MKENRQDSAEQEVPFHLKARSTIKLTSNVNSLQYIC